MKVPQKLLPPCHTYALATCIFSAGLLFSHYTAAQEFPKGWVFPLELGQGAVTTFNHAPDLYLGSLTFTPQYTLIKSRLRIGPAVAGAYTNKRIYGLAGPHLALMLTDKPKVLLSTVLNIQLTAEHLWGTSEQRLAGGGLTAEVGQMATFSLKALRDYHLNSWWLQAAIGINLFMQKPSENPFEGVH
ncbi:MAG TPA: hypothetical protein VFS25_08135 [Chitinophaga sp.]|uniref:hypothetical protein n=1 Tax=Chitinophaga sp. TaxID=1869181 RepID=UPI002DBDB9CA|nr:hypothetical protein [Chitinophaga sp.]HEU4552788.1 hypothetical protein [Chitinophaga sp.]